MAVTLFDVAPVLILVGFVAIGCLGVPAYARQSESQSAEARVATNVTALITGQGYAFEEHAVQTLDDYILAIQRIPYGLAGPSADGAKRPVAVLQHGIVDSAATWVVNDNTLSLAFILADAGYDVWMPNARGNTYSTGHASYSVSDLSYWAFTHDDHGTMDLPAVLDYVTETAGVASVGYVCHSQGCTSLFIGLSAAKDAETMRSKINSVSMLAPVTYMAHQGCPIFKIAKWIDNALVFDLFGSKGFFREDGIILGKMWPEACSHWPTLCEDILFLVTGPDMAGMDKDRVPYYSAITPAGTSTRNIVHFLQTMQGDGSWRLYDFGETSNLRTYGTKEPPQIQPAEALQGIPFGIAHGGNDYLADPKDVATLISVLDAGGLKPEFEVFEDGFAHLDLVWGTLAADRVYPSVLQLLGEHAVVA